jgi:hypothetical protein
MAIENSSLFTVHKLPSEHVRLAGESEGKNARARGGTEGTNARVTSQEEVQESKRK